MKQTYKVSGMSCGHCQARVKDTLLKLNDVKEAEVSLVEKTATISMDKEISIEQLQQALDESFTIELKTD